jgi:hypothetical protein
MEHRAQFFSKPDFNHMTITPITVTIYAAIFSQFVCYSFANYCFECVFLERVFCGDIITRGTFLRDVKSGTI